MTTYYVGYSNYLDAGASGDMWINQYDAWYEQSYLGRYSCLTTRGPATGWVPQTLSCSWDYLF